MGRFEDRMKVNRAVTVITIVVILMIFASSIIMCSGAKLNEPEQTWEQIDENRFVLNLEYDRQMASGTVKVKVSQGDIVDEGSIDVKPMKDNDRILTAEFTTTDSFTDPNVKIYNTTTDVQSTQQILNFFVIIVAFVPLAIIFSLATVRSLTTSVKRYSVNGSEMTLYCGMVRHELMIDNQVISHGDTWIPFQDAKLAAIVDGNNVMVEVSIMNNPSVYVNGYLVEECNLQETVTENDLNVQS